MHVYSCTKTHACTCMYMAHVPIMPVLQCILWCCVYFHYTAVVNKLIKEIVPNIRVTNDARDLLLNCCTGMSICRQKEIHLMVSACTIKSSFLASSFAQKCGLEVEVRVLIRTGTNANRLNRKGVCGKRLAGACKLYVVVILCSYMYVLTHLHTH